MVARGTGGEADFSKYKGMFWSDETVSFHDCGGGYIPVCQNS